MTAFQWKDSPSNESGRDRPMPCLIPHIVGAGLDMQCRRGHDCKVTGDLFDAVSPSPGLVLLMLMSVARHSHQALRLLAMGQDIFRLGAQQYGAVEAGAPDETRQPDSLLPEMLRQMQRSMDAAAPLYRATAILAAYETATATLRWVSAGAAPLLVKEGATVETVEGHGGPFGLPSGSLREQAEHRVVQARVLKPGSAVVFVSPGLVHATSHGAEFGVSRVAAELAAQTTLDPQEICRALVAAAMRFEQRPSHYGPPLRIDGFSNLSEEDMTAVALLPSI